ncbi:MAG: HAD-IA family hydrolase [Candidatus Nealsonbacteria bacterium]|nr:HAD-IA family hydrolase [Candidatus Nealsonbacteria bacterium]
MLKGVIFDLDGVLVETEYFQWRSWQEALNPFDVSLSKKKYFDYAGKTGLLIAKELVEDYQLSVDPQSLLTEKEALVLKWLKEKQFKRMPYAKKAIEFFVKRSLKVGVASGSPQDELILKLEKTGLDGIVGITASASEVEKGKPEPDVYLLALKRMQLKASESVCFEDTEYGARAAKAAGLTCFAIPNEFSQKQDFSVADNIFVDLREAVRWVGENYHIFGKTPKTN